MDWQNFSSELEVGITSYCQAECPLCDRTHKPKSFQLDHLTKKDFEKILFEVSPKIKTIRICGDWGDPLMNPYLNEILDYVILEKQISVRIHTNGGIRDNDWFVDCKKYLDNIEIVFGIDGTTKEINDMYRKKVDFNKAWSNMISCSSTLPYGKTTWQYIIFPHNLHQIDLAVELSKKFNINLYFTINTRTPFNDHEPSNIVDKKTEKYLIEKYGAWTEDF